MLVELDVATTTESREDGERTVEDENLEDLDIELEGINETENTENEEQVFRTISVRHDKILMIQKFNDNNQSLIFFEADIVENGIPVSRFPPMKCDHSRKEVHNKINRAASN